MGEPGGKAEERHTGLPWQEAGGLWSEEREARLCAKRKGSPEEGGAGAETGGVLGNSECCGRRSRQDWGAGILGDPPAHCCGIAPGGRRVAPYWLRLCQGCGFHAGARAQAVS